MNGLWLARLMKALCDGERALLIKLVEPDDMISWLNDLNSNWAVCRNTRSFIEGQPSEYWKKFDAAMGEAAELQVTLMKLHTPGQAARAPVAGEELTALRGLSEKQMSELAQKLFDALDCGGFRWEKSLSEEGKVNKTAAVKRILKERLTALARKAPVETKHKGEK